MPPCACNNPERESAADINIGVAFPSLESESLPTRLQFIF